MAFENLIQLAVTSTAGGAVSADTPSVIPGKVKSIRYVHDGTTPMTGTPSLTVTGTTTGKTILAVAAITGGGTDQEWLPQQLSNKNTDGTATTQFVDIPIAETIHVAMATCGASKNGTIFIVVGD